MEVKRERSEEDEAEAGLDDIDRLLADTFPASDPPSWTLGRERRAATDEHTSKTKSGPPGAR